MGVSEDRWESGLQTDVRLDDRTPLGFAAQVVPRLPRLRSGQVPSGPTSIGAELLKAQGLELRSIGV